MAEKPLISEETDLLEPTLLDELICNISTLASVYHKPPSSFVEGRTAARRFTLPPRAEPTPGGEILCLVPSLLLYVIKVIPLYCIAHPYCARFIASLAHAHIENGGVFFTAWVVREINRHFLVNKYGDL